MLNTPRRRIDALLAWARMRGPLLTRLPYLVMQVAWSNGPDKTPDYKEWQAAEHGEIEMSDLEGYEEHNRAAQALEKMRVKPKLYLFDPETEGTEP